MVQRILLMPADGPTKERRAFTNVALRMHSQNKIPGIQYEKRSKFQQWFRLIRYFLYKTDII